VGFQNLDLSKKIPMQKSSVLGQTRKKGGETGKRGVRVSGRSCGGRQPILSTTLREKGKK